MGAKDEATFRINIDGNAASASKEIATSARTAAKSIGEYENEVKALSADLRRLRGNSEEVVSAKKALKSKIDAAKGSVSSLTAELIKQGVSYKAAAEAAKKYGEATKPKILPNLRSGLGGLGGILGGALGGAGAKIGAKLAPLGKKIGDFMSPATKAIGTKLGPAGQKIGAFANRAAKSFGKAGAAIKEDFGSVAAKVGPMLGELALGAGALAVAAGVAMVAAFAAGTAALAIFSLATADAYAKMQRQREALLGTSIAAQNLGEHIGQLAGKVPQGVEELNALSLALSKTRISGKATVDAMNAIAQVTGAVDASAGSKIQELITRNDKFGRMAIGAFELDGTGLDFDDVAQAYAKGTKKSLEAARKELRMGIAPIEAGSKALRDAAEKKFGKLNMANAFSLENAPKKFMDQFRELSKDVDLGPISDALKEAFGQLSPNAPLGAAVKQFMTVFGGAMVDIAAKSIPVLLEGFTWLIVGALKLATVFYETKNAIADAFEGGDWIGVGKAIIVGITKGVFTGEGAIKDAMWHTGTAAIAAFKAVLGIHSPSKVFAKFGEHTTDGYVQGVDRGSRRADQAVEKMVSMPTASGDGGATNNNTGGPISITVQINGASTDSAAAMQSPSFLADLQRALRDSLSARGLAPV